MTKYQKTKYRAPSCKRLVNSLKLTKQQAIKVRRIIHGTLNPETIEAVSSWVDQCYHKPTDLELRMAAINSIIECYGVEAIPPNFTGNYPKAVFCNVGETYDLTILYDYSTDTFKLTSYGDYIERNERYFYRYQ